MRTFIHSIIMVSFIALLAGCSVTRGYTGHTIETQVQLSKANFDVIKTVEGRATANYFLGIGLSEENLFSKAKKDMLKKANLKGSQALVNFTTDRSLAWYIFSRELTIYVSAEVIEFK